MGHSAGLKIAFLAGLSDKKIAQKLLPLQALPEVARIDLFRRKSYQSKKVHWVFMPRWIAGSKILGDVYRLLSILVLGWRYDFIVGCHQEYHGVFAHWAGKLWRKPVIQLVISGVDWVYKRPLFRNPMMGASALGVRGPLSKTRVRELGFKGAVEIIHNPMRLIKMDANTNINEAEAKKKYDLAAVGDWAPIKDYPWLLEILAYVNRSRIVNLAIVGKGPYEKFLANQIHQLGLENRVSFPGWKDEKELAEFFSQSRALILTSRSEGLPMVVLEAMSHGLPVFVTPVGELPWLLRDGREGKMVSHGQTREMAEAIIEALDDKKIYDHFAINSKKRFDAIRADFGLQRISLGWKKLFQTVL